MTRKKMFGVIPYEETPEGDRLTKDSAHRTVQVGMFIGVLMVLFIASNIYMFMTNIFGKVLSIGFLVAVTVSWTITTWLSYNKVVDKVIDIYKKRGVYIEG